MSGAALAVIAISDSPILSRGSPPAEAVITASAHSAAVIFFPFILSTPYFAISTVSTFAPLRGVSPSSDIVDIFIVAGYSPSARGLFR